LSDVLNAGIKGKTQLKSFNRQGENMPTTNGVWIKLEITEEKLMAERRLALLAAYNHGIGLRDLVGRITAEGTPS
jgi:hypothetical protein